MWIPQCGVILILNFFKICKFANFKIAFPSVPLRCWYHQQGT